MEVKKSLSSRLPVGFLDIPLELRRQIYQYCLVRKDPIDVDYILTDGHHFNEWGVRDRKKSLLLVSRKVGFEALEVLYGDNVFNIDLHGHTGNFLEKYFAEANIQRIRKMQLVMKPQGWFYGRMLDSTLRSPVFANLRKLSIVAQQPVQGPRFSDALFDFFGERFGAPSFEREIEEWVEWLRTILQHIARQLPSSCIVEVDDDDERETSTVMRECLPSGYQKVQTLAGDYIFRRNKYSEESGFLDDDYDDYLYFDSDSDAS